MIKKSIWLLITISLLLSISQSGYLTPEHVQQHIKRLISQKYQLYVINLGNTINNHPLKAYVITGIKKQQSRIAQLRQYPATLITSYMHPREPYSVKLMQTVLDDVLNNFNVDYFFQYMLDNTLLILFPFVNIDGYYLYQKLIEQQASEVTKQRYRKNMNKYGTCLMDWQYGVDINRNFDAAWGSLRTSDNECGQQYRGPNPFSQKQSKAVRTLFNKFKITLAVDIHSYGNQWIYPYASQSTNYKLEQHRLYPLYKDLFHQFQLLKRPMKSCFESLQYTADGVYIDWALDQGALSFAVQIGTGFSGDINIGTQLLFQAQQTFHKVLRKNSISYQKYMTHSGQFVIISKSLLDFKVEVLDQNDKSLGIKDLFSLKSALYEIKDQKIVTLRILNTKIVEKLELSKLSLIDSDQIPDYNPDNSMTKLKKLFKLIIVIISAMGIIGGAYFIWKKKINNKEQRSFKLQTPTKASQQQGFNDLIQSQPSVNSPNITKHIKNSNQQKNNKTIQLENHGIQNKVSTLQTLQDETQGQISQ